MGGCEVMEKVTREQAEAIEHTRDTMGDAALILLHGKDKNGWIGNLSKRLNGMPILKLIDALRVGYEVEPEYKVGDFVANKTTLEIYEVVSVNENNITIRRNEFKGIGSFSQHRHATPEEIKQEKERRWWKKHGRGVWELRKGDVLRSKSTHLTYEIVDITDNGITFTNDAGFRDKDLIKGCYKVLCFAENRLDVNTNERSGTVGRYKEYARKRRRHTSI